MIPHRYYRSAAVVSLVLGLACAVGAVLLRDMRLMLAVVAIFLIASAPILGLVGWLLKGVPPRPKLGDASREASQKIARASELLSNMGIGEDSRTPEP